VSFFTGKDFINLPLPMPGEYDSLDVIAMRANAKRDAEIERLRKLMKNVINSYYGKGMPLESAINEARAALAGGNHASRR